MTRPETRPETETRPEIKCRHSRTLGEGCAECLSPEDWNLTTAITPAHDHQTAGSCTAYVGYVHLRLPIPGTVGSRLYPAECTLCEWSTAGQWAAVMALAWGHDATHRG